MGQRNVRLAETVTELEETEEALRRAHEALELRVDERTAELVKANEHLQGEIEERKRAQEALQESEEKYRDLVEDINDVIHVTDEHGVITYISPAIESFSGYSPSELIGQHFSSFIHPEDLPLVTKRFKKVISGQIEPSEYRILTKSGEYCWVRSSSRAIYRNGNVIGLRGVMVNVSKRKQAEEQIKASLREKEVLLREIHHRVKNNLQIVSSLLEMSIMQTKSQEAHELLTDSRSRVFTMALIHEQLYQTERFDRIEMENHIRDLMLHLSQVHAQEGRFIESVIEPSDVYLSVDKAVPCALALNELIGNAYKHAFLEKQQGRVEVSLGKSDDNTVCIRVKDDGIGISEQVDLSTVDTIGLRLVRNLVEEQLAGKLTIGRDGGTEVIMEFSS